MKKIIKLGMGAILASGITAGSAHAANDLVIRLMGNPKIEQNMVSYRCAGGDVDGVPDDTFQVNYLHGDDNTLAVLPIRDQNRIFAAVVASKGEKYMSGRYTWWRHNDVNATLMFVSENKEIRVTHCVMVPQPKK